MVIKILEMALPVLIMLGLGYFCKAKNVFDEKGLLGLKAFISNITLPVVLFLEGARNIYYAEIADPSVAVLSQSVIWDARGVFSLDAV